MSDIRIGDPERNRYIDHLNNMYSTGYLRQEEYEDRTSRIHECRFASELKELIADLPLLPQREIVPEKEKEEEVKEIKVHKNLHGGKFRVSTWMGATVGCALFAALIPTYDSAEFHGFANGGPSILVINIMALVAGIIGALVCLISFAPE
jgi:hypothetical protein